jgi:hypothetical protein
MVHSEGVQETGPPADAPEVTPRDACLPPVVLVARWTGYCLPCGTDDRLLALTRTGPRGLRAWLSGLAWEDGALLLTCTACGGVDPVGWDAEPEPEPAAEPVPEPTSGSLPARQVEAAVLPVGPSVPVQRQPTTLATPQVIDLARRAAARRSPVPEADPGPTGAADDDALDLLHLGQVGAGQPVAHSSATTSR